MRLNQGAELKHIIDPNREGMSRRRWLCRCANGFGGLALATTLAELLQQSRVQACIAAVIRWRSNRLISAPARSRYIFCFMTEGLPRLTLSIRNPDFCPSTCSRFRWRLQPLSSTSATGFLPHPSSSALWRIRCRGKRAVSRGGDVRRRADHHPFHGRQSFRAHSRELLHAHRYRIPGAPQQGSWITYGLGSVARISRVLLSLTTA